MIPITTAYARRMSSELDLLDLRVIRAVAETGGITAAAAALGYSQPAVTQRIRRAEGVLGQPLVLRSGRGVAVTEAGRRLASHAVHVQAALDAARQDLDSLAGGVTGTLRLAGFPSASPTLVPSILSSLRVSHPSVTLSYLEVEPPAALELVRDGAIDLALTFSYPGDGQRSDAPRVEGLRTTPLFRDTTMLVGPRGTFGAHADLAAVRSERFIGGCPRCRGHLLAVCRAAGFEPEVVLETDNALAVTGLVAAGLGIALLPGLSLLTAGTPAGVDVRPLPADADRIVQVVHSRGAERVPAVAAGLRAVLGLDAATFGLRPADRG